MIKTIINKLKQNNIKYLKKTAFKILTLKEYKRQSKNNFIPGFLVLEQVKKQTAKTILKMNKRQLKTVLQAI